MFTSVFSFLGVAIPADVLGALGLILGLICLDVIMGILASLVTKTFDVHKLANFLEAGILPYVGSLLILGAFSVFVPQIQAVFLPSTAAAAAKFIADIVSKFNSISSANVPTNNINNPPVDPQPIPAPGPTPSPVNDASVVTPAASKTLPDEPKEPPAK